MSKITLKEAKRKYNLTGTKYSSARTWWDLSWLPLPEELIREAADKVDWELISKYCKLSERFIREFRAYVNWCGISERQKLSEEFIREFKDKVYWTYISKYQKLSESFIREFKDKVDWFRISIYQKLSEGFIRKYQNYVDWGCISRYQKLSEAFIHEFKDKVDWYYISTYQRLSESSIREHQDYVKWSHISIYQPLSEDFIREFADKVDWWFIPYHQAVSKEFLQEFGLTLCNNSDKPESYWKERVEGTGLYECHEDFFYAYKGIRSDRYSKFNFQYQYLPGETYECFSDYSDMPNSFGLSAWTKEKAENYCDELVVKVKVYYKDVTAVIHGGGKTRCKRLTVME